ncbi:hypothetical protein BDV25DRAFT_168619 [Aspergillus avenaceus]|uniref:Uncharacterized protein n=1 Tax=Aspergillus avenaceus TaxID=36643 RepID=A0A5N6U4Q0_ASPAV|nr:hypothetical protein BDV25DRAFT_168619 [Aspergillus avenaceus]
MDVHVVSKTDNRKHAVIQVPGPTEEIQEFSVRVRTTLVALSSTNLSYAARGDLLHWWDAYPVPETAPAPYADRSQWGIVPAWGFGVVEESAIVELTPGTLLWGYWPTSNHAVDLKLIQAGIQNHWTEVSPHRQTLMSLYNRYIVSDKADNLEHLAWEAAVRPIWACGYLLSEYVFTPSPSLHTPIHPFAGAPNSGWTAEDADLSNAIVITLGASSKTARSAAHNFYCRPSGTGPLRFLQITSEPGSLSKAAAELRAPFPTDAVSYADIARSAEILTSKDPKKLVIVDFGGREGGFDQLYRLIKTTPALESCKLVIITIGFQQKVYTSAEAQAAAQSVVELGKIRFNTASLQEAAIKATGPTTYFEEISTRWEHWLAHRDHAAPDLKLVWGKGIVGADGIEGGWKSLCHGEVKPDQALVYRLKGEQA